MDQPGALAVKLNTRDRKGSGAHPGYGLKLSPATDRGPASRCHRWDTRIHPVLALAKGTRLAPSPKAQCHPSHSLGVSPQAEKGTGIGTASSFPIIWGRSEGTPGVSVGQSRPESRQLGSRGEPAKGQQQQAVVGAGGAAAVVSVVWSPTGQWRGEFLVFQCAGLV